MAEPYAEDCLHLKACRRFSLLLKKNGIIRARGCDPNYCTAYESKDEYYTREQVEAVKHGAAMDGAKGWDSYDLLIEDYI